MTMPGKYDTKTVRIHEAEQGRYVYLMLTRFDGDGGILGEIGYGAEYTHFAVMAQGNNQRVADTDPFGVKRKFPGEWFGDSHTMDFMYALDTGKISWTDLHDGQYLTPEDVADLQGVEA